MPDNEYKPQKDIEKELTVEKFVGQQARTIGFTVGGGLLGVAVGKYGLANTSLPEKIGKLLNKKTAEDAKKLAEHTHTARAFIIPAITGTLGYTVGQIAALYEHWANVERERLGVEEVNKDVATLMAKRMQFEETIDKQGKLVDEMINQQKKFSDSLSSRTQAGELSQTDKLEAKLQEETAAKTQSRG